MSIKPGSRVTLVGGAKVQRKIFESACSFAPVTYAADGGVNQALEQGAAVEAVIGDMDSVSVEAKQHLQPEKFIHYREQNSTDFEKAIRYLEAELIIAIGFMGGRRDHELAAYSALIAHPDRRIILLGEDDIIFLAPREFRLNMMPGERFSLFPFGKVRGRSSGLKWPIDTLAFSPSTRIGTSNIVEGPIELSFENPNMLVIVPPKYLRHVISMLERPETKFWPAAHSQ